MARTPIKTSAKFLHEFCVSSHPKDFMSVGIDGKSLVIYTKRRIGGNHLFNQIEGIDKYPVKVEYMGKIVAGPAKRRRDGK